MTLFFKSQVNHEGTEDTKVELGQGHLKAANIVMQGFYMSYDNTDHRVKDITTSLSDSSTYKEGKTNYFKYKSIADAEDRVNNNAFITLRSLIIAQLN